MKPFLKKHAKKIMLLACDLLCVIAALICGPLSGVMLQDANHSCIWALMGFQCLTCGGTHFVNDLFSGRIGMAFMDNQFLFFATIYLVVSLVALNLWLLFDWGFAKKMLGWMYNIPTLIIWGAGTLSFVILRNLPTVISMLQTL